MFRRPRWLSSAVEFLNRHERLLWGLHSLWALALGIVVMWAGARNYAWLRVTILYIAFLWVTSLFVPALVDRPGAGTTWRGRLRLVINYFTKNFYQQLLFFLLPIYYASASAWSANLLFVGFLAASALISTFDVFFDQHLSVRRGLTAVFFAFNLFACINVMLPVLWSISNSVALRVSALLAVVAFATIRYGFGELARRQNRRSDRARGDGAGPARGPRPTADSAGALARAADGVRHRDRPGGVPGDRSGCSRCRSAGRAASTRVTSIYAPLGLRDRVGHRWYQDGRLDLHLAVLHARGRPAGGFPAVDQRAGEWTFDPGTRLRVEVWTEAGQLVGRGTLRCRRADGILYRDPPRFTMTTSYTAKDITVLEGLEPVRKRPGMYIGGVGSAGLHHLAWEILDNAIDEAMNGYASSLAVTLHADGSSISVTDDGRGIPVDKHPQTKKSALEVIFTMLHAGGEVRRRAATRRRAAFTASAPAWSTRCRRNWSPP